MMLRKLARRNSPKLLDPPYFDRFSTINSRYCILAAVAFLPVKDGEKSVGAQQAVRW